MANTSVLEGEGARTEGQIRLSRALDAAIRTARPEIVEARARVALDEAKIYAELFREMLDENIAKRVLADKRGITLPRDAGVNAIKKIKDKFFSKMDQAQLVASFNNLTSRITLKRKRDPKYVLSREYRIDDYWLKGLIQVMHDKRYLDDPQGTAEKKLLDGITAAGGNAEEYKAYIDEYRNSAEGKVYARDMTGSKTVVNLDAIMADSSKCNALKAVFEKIELDSNKLSGPLNPLDVAMLIANINNKLTDYDLRPIGVSADALKSLIQSLANPDAQLLNNLRTIIF